MLYFEFQFRGYTGVEKVFNMSTAIKIEVPSHAHSDWKSLRISEWPS